MLIDLEKSKDSRIDCDVCIIGAGPAGLTLANELLDTDLNVVVLESGGRKKPNRVQSLSSGSLSGELYEPPEQWHLRQIGGTANHWIVKLAGGGSGYRFAKLSASDFEPNEFQELSGWPISLTDLEPYYSRALDLTGILPSLALANVAPLRTPFDKLKNRMDFETGLFSFAPTKVFTKTIPKRIKNSTTKLFYNATVVELRQFGDSSDIESAVVRLRSGGEVIFRAKRFVIACGGVQSARLLLVSNGKYAEGIGNQNDVVGRYYMDHSLVPSGNFFPHSKKFIKEISVFDTHVFGDTMFLPFLAINEERRNRMNIRNIAFSIFPMPSMRYIQSLRALKTVIGELRSFRFFRIKLSDIFAILHSSGYIFRTISSALILKTPISPGFGMGGWSKKNDLSEFERVELLAFAEQSPAAGNRVTLSDAVDYLGVRKVNVHFEWPEGDLESILRAQEFLEAFFNSLGEGEFIPDERPIQPHIGSLGLHHSLGTTRMGHDPRTSVTNPDCRVHDVDNLFIASSSVFPTGGYANPTLTILALAIRIADKIRDELKQV